MPNLDLALNDEAILAAIYTRLSKGFGRSIDEQEAEDRAECAEHDWTVYDVYSDESRSASRFAAKTRSDWERLLADLDAGRFQILVLWEASRGDRKPARWMDMLDLCRERGVKIHITSDGRTYDMSRRRDWRVLADEGVNSADESEKISERIRRDVKANAIAGRPHGKVPYGYERIYDEHTKALTEQRRHPEQAPNVRKIITDVSRSVPVSVIERDLNERGVPSPAGGKWSRAMIRNIAANPAYVGKRAWKGTILPGTWEPLVDEATFSRAQRVLSDQKARGSRPGRAKYMLSGVALCDVCKAPVVPYPRGARRPVLYGCPDGHAYIRQDWLDAWVRAAMLTLLDSPHSWKELARDGDADVLAARAEADRLQVQLDELARDLDISPRTLANREAVLLPAIRAAEKRAREVSAPPAVRDLLGGGSVPMREIWEAMPLQARKDCIRALLVVRLRPAATKGGDHGFDPSRVIVERAKREPGDAK
jgi:site-specific DNA recombinase